MRNNQDRNTVASKLNLQNRLKTSLSMKARHNWKLVKSDPILGVQIVGSGANWWAAIMVSEEKAIRRSPSGFLLLDLSLHRFLPSTWLEEAIDQGICIRKSERTKSTLWLWTQVKNSFVLKIHTDMPQKSVRNRIFLMILAPSASR